MLKIFENQKIFGSKKIQEQFKTIFLRSFRLSHIFRPENFWVLKSFKHLFQTQMDFFGLESGSRPEPQTQNSTRLKPKCLSVL